MAKTGSPFPGPTGLAEWLPLLGSICLVLAALGEEEEAEPANSTDATDSTDATNSTDSTNSTNSSAVAAQRLQTGEERG